MYVYAYSSGEADGWHCKLKCAANSCMQQSNRKHAYSLYSAE